jgi:hypothetical protein
MTTHPGPHRWAGVWLAAGILAAIVGLEATVLWPPGAAQGHLLSVIAAIAADAFTASLLVLFLARPTRSRGADLPLVMGAWLLTAAVAYRVTIQVAASASSPGPAWKGLPTGPFVDPLLESGAMTLGMLLLAAGVARLGWVRSGWWRRWSVAQVVVVLAGGLAVMLVTAAAIIAPGVSLAASADESRAAELVGAVGDLGWTLLAFVALAWTVPARARWGLAAGAVLLLASHGLAAFDWLVAEWWWGPLRAWFPGLLDWHDGYIYVAVLAGLGWAALLLAFAGLTRQTDAAQQRRQPEVQPLAPIP